MARSYGRITTSIWRDSDFRSLTPTQQAVYFMLITQPEVTAAGTLPLTYRRWAKLADGMTPARIKDEIDSLAARGHVVIDADTEELLIRTFVKWDGGWSNSKRRPVIRDAALGIASSILRAALAAELAKLGLADMASELLPDTASDTAPDSTTPSDRVVVTLGESVTTTHNPQPTTRTPVASATRTEPAKTESTTAQTIVGEWIERAPKRPPQQVVGQVAKLVGQMLAEAIDPDDVRRGLAAWMTKGLHPSTLPSVVNEVMNARPQSTRDDVTRARVAARQANPLASAL